MTDFVQFAETNDHEGETWNFWLQVDGNETELDKLRELLAAAEEDGSPDFPYELADEPTPESEVDVLVKHTDTGYMAYQNKITGVFTCPDSLGEHLDDLYKGGIKAFFKEKA